MASGEEILIVDSVQTDEDGLRKFFESEGYVCSAASMATVEELVEAKFYPAAIVDLDVGDLGKGLDIVRTIRQRSPRTGVVLLSSRRSFEAAVEAYRLGIVDFVLKQPDQVPHLRRVVAVAVDRYRNSGDQSALLHQVQEMMEATLRVLLTLAPKAYRDAVSPSSGAQMRPRMLLVETDAQFAGWLSEKVHQAGWGVTIEGLGGAALDKISSETFDIVASKDQLVDLPGAMIVKTAQEQRRETLGLVYSEPGPHGRIELYSGGKTSVVESAFSQPAQLMDRLSQLLEEVRAVEARRHYVKALRSEHEHYLQSFTDLKARIDSLL